jgi:hypothetical protein
VQARDQYQALDFFGCGAAAHAEYSGGGICWAIHDPIRPLILLAREVLNIVTFRMPDTRVAEWHAIV